MLESHENGRCSGFVWPGDGAGRRGLRPGPKPRWPDAAPESASPTAATHEVVPVEATTQGNRVVFPGGDISWVDAVMSFTPGDPAASRSRDPNAALGKPDYQGVDDAEDEATYRQRSGRWRGCGPGHL